MISLTLRSPLTFTCPLALCVLLSPWLAVLTYSQQQGTSRDARQLKTELEETYGKLKVALKNKDYDGFIALYEPLKDERPMSKKQWTKVAKFLNSDYEELATTRFIQVDKSGEWAGYYFQSVLENPNWITLSVRRFHMVGKVWKVVGFSYHKTFPKATNGAENKARIIKELETNAWFRLPGQSGFTE